MANRTSPSHKQRAMQVGKHQFHARPARMKTVPHFSFFELTQNSLEAIQRLPDKKGEIIWDVDCNTYDLTGVFKLYIRDTVTP